MNHLPCPIIGKGFLNLKIIKIFIILIIPIKILINTYKILTKLHKPSRSVT